MRELGEYLRREREARGISLDEIQEITKIRVRYLEAIERGEFADIPGETYVRGFLRNYARAVGLDGQAVLERYKTGREAAARAEATARAEAAEAAAEAARRKEAGPEPEAPPGPQSPGEPATAAVSTRAALSELLRAIEVRRTSARVDDAVDSEPAAKPPRLEVHRVADAEDDAVFHQTVVGEGAGGQGEGLSERVRARRLARRRRLWQVAAIAGAVAFLLGLWMGANRRARMRTASPAAPTTIAQPAFAPAPAEAPPESMPAPAEPAAGLMAPANGQPRESDGGVERPAGTGAAPVPNGAELAAPAAASSPPRPTSEPGAQAMPEGAEPPSAGGSAAPSTPAEAAPPTPADAPLSEGAPLPATKPGDVPAPAAAP